MPSDRRVIFFLLDKTAAFFLPTLSGSWLLVGKGRIPGIIFPSYPPNESIIGELGGKKIQVFNYRRAFILVKEYGYYAKFSREELINL